jgi:hypothetical protein
MRNYGSRQEDNESRPRGMNRHSFRYRLVDLAELALDDADLTVPVRPGEANRAGDGMSMVVTEAVETADELAYAGVLVVETTPLSGAASELASAG